MECVGQETGEPNEPFDHQDPIGCQTFLTQMYHGVFPWTVDNSHGLTYTVVDMAARPLLSRHLLSDY